jgi:hypothetical protein
MVVLGVRLKLGGRLGYFSNLFFSSICAFRTEAEEDTSADSRYDRQSTNNSSYYGTDYVKFLDIGKEVLDCVELGYRPLEDEDEVGDEPEIEDELEVELLLGIVVEVVFSMIGELDPDSVVDFDNDTVPMTVKNACPTCPV